ncbi:VOC family protein [Bacillus taeanensis]|nr:VOC family protein [Bacillus taeanensis]
MIKRVEHVGIIVSNMEESINFYCNLFDFNVEMKQNTGKKELVFLSHSGLPGFEIELIRDLEQTNDYSEHGLVNHLAFVVDDIEDVVECCKQKGVNLEVGKIKRGMKGRKTMRFKGPNGEVLQLVEERK